MSRRRARASLAMLLLVASSGGAAWGSCTTDVVCAADCRAKICGASDPDGDPREAHSACVSGCRDTQPNCAALVTCMKACAEVRDAALAKCRTRRQSCIRSTCRVCTRSSWDARAAVLSPSCVAACRTERDKCLMNRFAMRVCRAKCEDRCGAFRDAFPAALEECLSRCGEGGGCRAAFQECRSACIVP